MAPADKSRAIDAGPLLSQYTKSRADAGMDPWICFMVCMGAMPHGNWYYGGGGLDPLHSCAELSVQSK